MEVSGNHSERRVILGRALNVHELSFLDPKFRKYNGDIWFGCFGFDSYISYEFGVDGNADASTLTTGQ